MKTKAQSERAVETSLEEIQKSVLVFVSLINMCKTHEKVSFVEITNAEHLNYNIIT